MRVHFCCTPKQVEILRHPARFKFIGAGRRWGKTFLSRTELVARALQGFHCWYIGPSASNSTPEYRAVLNHPALQDLIIKARVQPYPQIWVEGGGSIGYRTFERPDLLRGHGLDYVWVDEIQEINEDDFSSVILPLVSDKRGKLTLSGQFRGHNWYYKKYYLPGQDPAKQKLYASWRLPTSTGVRYQGEEGKQELELMRQQMPRWKYEVEFECNPLGNDKAVFRPDDLERCKRGRTKDRPEAGKHYVAWLDLGRVKDPSALGLIEAETCTVVHSESRPLGERHDDTARYAASIVRRFNAQLVVDSTGGGGGGSKPADAIVGHYRKFIPNLREYVWTRHTKQRLIDTACIEIEQGRPSIPTECETLHRQLLAYERHDNRFGFEEYGAPPGEKDDEASGFFMALWAVRAGWVAGGLPLSALSN